MKRFLGSIVCLLLMFCLVGPVFAEDASVSITGVLEDALTKLKLEDMRQGTAIDFINEGRTCYTFTKPLWILEKEGKWYDKRVALEIGYTSTDKLMAGASVNLLKVGDFTDIPLINLLRLDVGGWVGYGRIQIGGGMNGNNEFASGLYATFLRITK